MPSLQNSECHLFLLKNIEGTARSLKSKINYYQPSFSIVIVPVRSYPKKDWQKSDRVQGRKFEKYDYSDERHRNIDARPTMAARAAKTPKWYRLLRRLFQEF